MTARTWIALSLLAGIAAIVGLNQSGTPVPGLEWVRLDTLASKLGIGAPSQPAPAGSDTAATAPKRGSGGGGGRRGQPDGPVPVVVASAATADVPVYLRGVGSARAPNTVTVRPQVDGRLIKVSFREGQDVKKGDLLAEIDPITYQASLAQAVAKRNLTQSQLANAELDLDRLSRVGPGVASVKTVDTQRALVAQLTAQVRSDEAGIANAEAVLGYTRLLSPIDGRTGQRLVDEGNLVRAGDAGIVTIAQIKPISVQFTLPQQQLAQVQKAMLAGPVLVEAMDGDDVAIVDGGSLTFVDNAIDQTTGTVKMKADLPNERLQLWPGQFANVRVRVDVLKQAITIPTAALQRGPQGAFVYVVGGQAPKVAVGVRPVTVVQQDDRLAVVSKGVAVGDQVVTSGFARLKDQTEVIITRTENGDGGKDGGRASPPTVVPGQVSGATGSGPEAGSAPGDGKSDAVRRAAGEGGKGERGNRRNKPAESAIQ